MASHFFFNGRLHTTPIAVSAVDDTRMSPQNPAVGNFIAILGSADAGEPQKALTFSSPREAERALKGGELLVAVRKAFAPSASTAGPAKVTVVRVDRATRSTLTLKDSTGSDAVVLTSQLFGLYANQIRVMVETGTLAGKRITTRLGNDYYVSDNIGRSAFKLRYAGAGASALADVTPTTVVLKAGTSGSETTIATINLVDTPTVQQLVDRINSYAGFTATITAGSALKPTVRALDGVTAADCKTADLDVRRDLQEIIEWFNGNAEGFMEATRPTAAVKMPANISYTFLTGATQTAPVYQDWVDGLDVLTNEDVQWIVPLSPDAGVHAAADAHCVFMSDAGRKERRAFVGPESGLDVDDVKLLPRQLGSDRTALVWPGHYDIDPLTGLKTLLPPYMSAVLVAGGFAGVNPGTPMTNKSVRCQGLEYNPSFPADTDILINSGVLTFENTARGIRVCRSISTWLENDNFNRVEVSCGAAVDFMVRAVREALEPLVGSKASPQILGRAAQITESVLLGLARPEPQGPAVIVGDRGSPPFQNIQCSIEGDVLFVAFEASPVVPLNFVAISVSVVPYRGTLRVGA
jgi:hypothetical protein